MRPPGFLHLQAAESPTPVLFSGRGRRTGAVGFGPGPGAICQGRPHPFPRLPWLCPPSCCCCSTSVGSRGPRGASKGPGAGPRGVRGRGAGSAPRQPPRQPPRRPRAPALLTWPLARRQVRRAAGENPPRQGLTSLKLAPQVGGCPLPGFSFFFCVLRSPGRGGGWASSRNGGKAASPGQEADSTSLSVRRGEESWTKSDQGRSGKYRSQVCFRAPRDPGKSKECRQMKSGF